MLRVLVADDDPIQRSLVSARLARLNGQTVEAEDGVAAWALLSTQTFDMAIVDLSMPNLDGFGLIQCMRDHPRTRHLPIIVITSHHDRDSIEKAMRAGASSFLVKPIAWSTFEHHIGFLLQMVQAAKDARNNAQCLVAAHRAREAILGRLCGDANATNGWLMQQIEDLQHLSSAAAPQQQAPVPRLAAMLDECRSLKTHATIAVERLDALTEQVAVADRKECLALIVGRVIDACATPIADKRIECNVTLPSGDTWLACDGDAIQTALHNLLLNATAHVPAGGKVSIVGTLYPDGLLAIEITDNGAGMSPGVLAQSFAPLKTRMAGQSPSASAGFGLLVAKAIAEAHGGSLELRSMPQQGTNALFVLPPERVTNIRDLDQ